MAASRKARASRPTRQSGALYGACPTIVAAGFTLGVKQQIMRAFGRAESSFQYLVRSWPTIVELLSIYKRLKAFEATLDDEPPSDIEREVMPPGNPAQVVPVG